jgi:hypothetical protein
VSAKVFHGFQLLILPTHVVGSAAAPPMGATSMVSIPLMMDHKFSNLNNNVSLCLQMWKQVQIFGYGSIQFLDDVP